MKLDRLSTPSLCAVFLAGQQIQTDAQDAIDGGREYFRQLLSHGGISDEDRDARLRRPGFDLVVKPYEKALNDQWLRHPSEPLRYERAKRPIDSFMDAYSRLLNATDSDRGVDEAERWFNFTARSLTIHMHELESVLSERLEICSIRDVAEAHLALGIEPAKATTADLARAVLTAELENKLDAPEVRSGGPRMSL